MADSVPRETVQKVRKLAQLVTEASQSPLAVSVTKLTSLKSLCQDTATANQFAAYLARKTLDRVEKGNGHSAHPGTPEDLARRAMMAEALAAMEEYTRAPTEKRRWSLGELRGRLQAEQHEHRSIPFGAVRLINDWDLLVIEDALHCFTSSPREAGRWAYQIARDYAERYDPSRGTGLTPESVPMVQDIVDFWVTHVGLDLSTPTPTGRGKAKEPAPKVLAGAESSRGKGAAGKEKPPDPPFTHRQGQFLAFIHLYQKMHRRPPAETDMRKFFRVTPPAVHGMVVKLDELGLITREPGAARSLRVTIPEEEIPPLEAVDGPPW